MLEKKKAEEEKKRKEMETLDTDSMGSDSNHGSQGQFKAKDRTQAVLEHVFRHADEENLGNAIEIIIYRIQ